MAPAGPSAASPAISLARQPELTLRAILTGVVIGAILTPCNVYSGLKIGWAFNMAIAAVLLGFGFWQVNRALIGTRSWGILENNTNQMVASSAASNISGGLVAPLPALTLLTGQVLPWYWLIFWVAIVSILGVIVAAGLRNQMLLREKLSFPAGIATAETMTRIHDRGDDAVSRLKLLLSAAAVSGAIKAFHDLVIAMPRVGPGLKLPGSAAAPTLSNLGFTLDPSLLMLGFGAIIGLRAGLSILLGAVVAWGLLAPYVLAQGWAEPGAIEPQASWFAPLVTWLLWPGATLMVVASLVSFGISLLRLYGGKKKPKSSRWARGLGWRGHAFALSAIAVLIALTAAHLFGIGFWTAIGAVGVSYILAIVATRATGETGITPIGAMGQVTQLAYSILAPGQIGTNLMTANITGGAAGQCADLMQDLKTGMLIGATFRFQILAQFFGVIVGSVVGSIVYLLLIPDPRSMLITPEWPAPAVATWKAVAEVLTAGLASIPTGALPAMAVAAVLGVILALAEQMLPPRHARWLPSAPAIGLAFVVPAWNAISLFLGAAAAALIARIAPQWAERHVVGLAAGLVAGESLIGVATLALRALD
jgi:Predicted membrane protein